MPGTRQERDNRDEMAKETLVNKERILQAIREMGVGHSLPIVISSRLPPDRLLNRIRLNVEEERFFGLLSYMSMSRNVCLLGRFKEAEFRLRVRGLMPFEWEWNYGWRLTFWGEIRSAPEGSEIIGRLGISPMVKAFIWLWFGAIGWFSISMTIRMLWALRHYGLAEILAGVFALMLVQCLLVGAAAFGVWAVRLPHSTRQREERLITELLMEVAKKS